jgi:hypothetical protein
MTEAVYTPATSEIAERRKQLAPAIHDAFQEFSRQAFGDGSPGREGQAAHRCGRRPRHPLPDCLQGQAQSALRKGASEREIMEAVWVAAEMRAGGAYAHSTWALETAGDLHGSRAG